jgi:NADPH:quinone reductase-like Zn-dependent oxidoreductase
MKGGQVPILIPAEAPHPLTVERNPVQLGHEFAGHVTEVGRGVTGLAEGSANQPPGRRARPVGMGCARRVHSQTPSGSSTAAARRRNRRGPAAK